MEPRLSFWVDEGGKKPLQYELCICCFGACFVGFAAESMENQFLQKWQKSRYKSETVNK